MARWLIDGRIGEYGQLVVVWRDGRLTETRFPVDDLADFAQEAAMFAKDKKVARVERRMDGVVVESIEGVH